MPKIKMSQTQTGASDGIHVLTYEAGGEYVVSESLAANFIGQGVAIVVDAPAAIEEPTIATEEAGPAEPEAPAERRTKALAPAEAKPAGKHKGTKK